VTALVVVMVGVLAALLLARIVGTFAVRVWEARS